MELSNTNILTFLSCYETHNVIRLTGDDVAVVCLPMFHIAGPGSGSCALDKVPARLCSKRSV